VDERALLRLRVNLPDSTCKVQTAAARLQPSGCQVAGGALRGGHLGGRSLMSSGDGFQSCGHRCGWDRNWDPGGDDGGSDGQNWLRLSGKNPSVGVVGLYSGPVSDVVQSDLLGPYGPVVRSS
jgi:hypothetical protein